MRSASAGFASVVAGSHTVVTRVDVLFDGAVVVEGVPVEDGTVSYDRSAARLARLDVTLPRTVPVGDPPPVTFTPFGYELAVWRGVMLPSGAELVPLGVFPIQTTDIDGVSLVTSISAEDRSRRVSDARFEDDYQIAAGTNYATAIQTMIEDGVGLLPAPNGPGFEFLFPSTSFVTPLLTFDAQSDRWDAATQMAKSIGNEIFFDGLGRCVMQPEPTFTADPATTIVEGTNLVGIGLRLDRATAYNRVIAFSTNADTGAQYRGVATDTDPGSPTQYGGPFGRKPRFYASEFIASNKQARSAAAAILAANLGVSRAVDCSAVPDPRLECSDVVLVRRASLDVDELHIVDAMTIGLGPEPVMTVTARAQQEAS